MDEPIVEETNPEQSQAQRRWEGMIRVSKSRTEAGSSSARVQQLVAEPATGGPPRVHSAGEARAGGRRWQPEPADWTSTVFGIELPHDPDCPLYDDEPDEPEYAADENPPAEAPGAFEGEAPAPPVDEVPEEPVDEPVDEPVAEAAVAEWIPFTPTDPWGPPLDAAEFIDPEDDEVVGGVVLIPVAEAEPAEADVSGMRVDTPGMRVPRPIIDDRGVTAAEHPVIDAADLDLVAVQLEVLAQGLSNAIDERYTELAVVVPPRSEPRPAAQARVPGSRRESDPVMPSTGIGATLAAARQSAGLTHDQLARITRIGVARLVEFENDDYSGCGADIFARGRLDSIARAVGVDPEPLLQEFDARYGGVHTVTYGVGGRPQIRMPRNWTLVLLCALAVAGIYPVALLVVAVLG
ncbi:MAG TPA: helix-turn-helix domain-containing protein [Sporichthyaceae bacterium]|jgi:transcriptional regulator with XRE-family HTH domain|nr:helix-turn-helix domain-containing protein [Sporichthyaceae bacterium]